MYLDCIYNVRRKGKRVQIRKRVHIARWSVGTGAESFWRARVQWASQSAR